MAMRTIKSIWYPRDNNSFTRQSREKYLMSEGEGAFYCPKGQKISTLLYAAWFLMVNKSESLHLEFNLATFITPDVF